ncbi:flavodoxin family protein [Methanosphaera sp.]
MKITVLNSSPHKEGTSVLLTEKFIEGATIAGHDVYRFDAAFEDVSACNGCDSCISSGKCVKDDDMSKLIPHLLKADLIVFVTPLYYFGMDAQLKLVIDRFYSINSQLMSNNNKSMLFATSWDDNSWTMEALEHHYDILVKYLHFENAGRIIAKGCGVRSDIERSTYPDIAFEMGKNL